MRRQLKIFSEEEFFSLEQRLMLRVQGQVHGEQAEYLLNVDEETYKAHLVSEAEIPSVELHFDATDATSAEQMISADRFPPFSRVDRNRSYAKQVVTFHIPFSGAPHLLTLSPNPRLSWTAFVELDDKTSLISVDYVNFDNIDQVNQQFDGFRKNSTQQLESLKRNIAAFNSSLPQRTKQIFDERKSQLQKQASQLVRLSVPIRKQSVPTTFSVPAAAPKMIVPRPKNSNASSNNSLDPTLSDEIYESILEVIHHVGKQMERLPETYRGRDEETLRDHFLLVLQPHFGREGSATGETFNSSGKTDILIRYENSNVFVSEFKFWGGAKLHLETIDQLLSYLTWRDSKTAIVYFIEGEEISTPLKAIEDATPKHGGFAALKKRKDDSWFMYELLLPGDSAKKVQVAVLCFHLPKK